MRNGLGLFTASSERDAAAAGNDDVGAAFEADAPAVGDGVSDAGPAIDCEPPLTDTPDPLHAPTADASRTDPTTSAIRMPPVSAVREKAPLIGPGGRCRCASSFAHARLIEHGPHCRA